MKPTIAVLSGILMLVLIPSECKGAVTIIAREINGNVEFAGSGTINLAGFSTFRDVSLLPGIVPTNAQYPPDISIGGNVTGSIPADAYGGFPTGPAIFGSGPFRVADSVSGDRFGAGNNLFVREIYVPDGYQSGAMLTGSSTYFTETFASLGINPGTYVWAWGSDSDADSLTLTIVPEPSAALLLTAAGVIVVLRRK